MGITPEQLHHIKNFQQSSIVELVLDEQALFHYQSDFGGIASSQIAAVAKPKNIQQLTQFLEFAQHYPLPLTIRSLGLSQSGQAVAEDGGVIIDVTQLKNIGLIDASNSSITVDCGASWKEVVAQTLAAGYIPYVLPFNLDLSVGGVISAGGFGAASTREGVVAGHVNALNVITANGQQYSCDQQKHPQLFDAVRGGMGRLGIINNITLALRKAEPNVRTFYLLYDNHEQWLHDQMIVAQELDCNYVEAFCTPCIQGLRNTENGRGPFPYWLYALHLSYEYSTEPPQITRLKQLNYYRHTYTEDNSIADYVNRHQPRFDMMKANGSWQLLHPWYECFIPQNLIKELLPKLLEKTPLSLGGIYQLFPISRANLPKYLMMPAGDPIMAFAILTPGITQSQLPSILKFIDELDELLLSRGCKRYLSGWLNASKSVDYWQRHYAGNFESLCEIKDRYDPHNIFRSAVPGLV